MGRLTQTPFGPERKVEYYNDARPDMVKINSYNVDFTKADPKVASKELLSKIYGLDTQDIKVTSSSKDKYALYICLLLSSITNS